MCRSLEQGGRRCTGHAKGARRSVYEKALRVRKKINKAEVLTEADLTRQNLEDLHAWEIRDLLPGSEAWHQARIRHAERLVEVFGEGGEESWLLASVQREYEDSQSAVPGPSVAGRAA